MYGRYIEYVKINCNCMVVELRFLRCQVCIDDKTVTTDKWMDPSHWKEVEDIIISGIKKHIKQCKPAVNSTEPLKPVIVAGRNVQVAYVFKPCSTSVHSILQPYEDSIEEKSGVVDPVTGLEDKGGQWQALKPHSDMLIASISLKSGSCTVKETQKLQQGLGLAPEISSYFIHQKEDSEDGLSNCETARGVAEEESDDLFTEENMTFEQVEYVSSGHGEDSDIIPSTPCNLMRQSYLKYSMKFNIITQSVEASEHAQGENYDHIFSFDNEDSVSTFDIFDNIEPICMEPYSIFSSESDTSILKMHNPKSRSKGGGSVSKAAKKKPGLESSAGKCQFESQEGDLDDFKTSLKYRGGESKNSSLKDVGKRKSKKSSDGLKQCTPAKSKLKNTGVGKENSVAKDQGKKNQVKEKRIACKRTCVNRVTASTKGKAKTVNSKNSPKSPKKSKSALNLSALINDYVPSASSEKKIVRRGVEREARLRPKISKNVNNILNSSANASECVKETPPSPGRNKSVRKRRVKKTGEDGRFFRTGNSGKKKRKTCTTSSEQEAVSASLSRAPSDLSDFQCVKQKRKVKCDTLSSGAGPKCKKSPKVGPIKVRTKLPKNKSEASDITESEGVNLKCNNNSQSKCKVSKHGSCQSEHDDFSLSEILARREKEMDVLRLFCTGEESSSKLSTKATVGHTEEKINKLSKRNKLTLSESVCKRSGQADSRTRKRISRETCKVEMTLKNGFASNVSFSPDDAEVKCVSKLTRIKRSRPTQIKRTGNRTTSVVSSETSDKEILLSDSLQSLSDTNDQSCALEETKEKIRLSSSNENLSCSTYEATINAMREEEDKIKKLAEACAKITKKLSEDVLSDIFHRNLSKLKKITTGKVYSSRHEQYNEGGAARMSLRYAASTNAFTDAQIKYLLQLIASKFCAKPDDFFLNMDYFMKVLLPELATLIFMEVNNVSHSEALERMRVLEVCFE